MRFRPCIDIHNGTVKQIVGGSLSDSGVGATNFVSSFTAEEGGTFYGEMYRRMGLPGGHIILLNPTGTEGYAADMKTAEAALRAFPGGLQIGGGVTAENAETLLNLGATHVIVTSWVFREGKVDRERLKQLQREVGKDHLVLDLSCRKTERGYCIATDRWQKLTDTYVNQETLDELSEYAEEFLIHAVDAEGKRNGIEEELAELLGTWALGTNQDGAENVSQKKCDGDKYSKDGIDPGKGNWDRRSKCSIDQENGNRDKKAQVDVRSTSEKTGAGFPITYAGGVGSFADLARLKTLGRGLLDVTIGSALDIFGGEMKLTEVVEYLTRETEHGKE